MDSDKTKRIFDAMEKFKTVNMLAGSINELSHREFMLLKMISQLMKDSKENCGIQTTLLSECLGVSKSNISQILNVLETKELIQRISTKNDRRIVYVTLTDLGEKKFKKSLINLSNFFSNIFYELGDKDTEEFIRLLNKLSDIANNLKENNIC